jgi:hypothetical protein
MADARVPNETHPPPNLRIWPFFVIPLLLVGASLIAFRLVNPSRGAEEAPRVTAGQEHPPPQVLDGGGEPVSIEEGDRRLRALAIGWSADPLFGRWLDVMSLRHLVAAVQLMADGESVKPALAFLSIQGPFAVREERVRPAAERLFIAPVTYARYDGLVRVVGSIDAAAAGDAYVRLAPFFEAAFAEIGRPNRAFEDVLTAAVRRVVQVKLTDGEVELVPKGTVYAFKDPALEGLTAGEKQVLRLGPQNGEVLQRQLRKFAAHARLELVP